MQQMIDVYNQFLSLFPDPWHPWVSVAVVVVMVMLVLKFWKVGVIGIVLLVLFVPASIPVLKNIFDFLLSFAKR